MSTPESPADEPREPGELPTVSEPPSPAEPRPSTEAARRVRARWVLAGVAVAAAVVWVVALTVGPHTSPVGPETPPQPTPVPATVAPGQGSEGSESVPRLAHQGTGESAGQTALLSEVRKSDAVALDDANVVGIAFQTCAALRSGSTRATVEAAVVEAGTPDPRAAGDLVGAAIANLCPEEEGRPLERVMRDGAYRAGIDVEPGRYVAPGGDGCTWTRSSAPGQSLAAVIDSGSGPGPSMSVTLEGDQYFFSSRCGEWTRD